MDFLLAKCHLFFVQVWWYGAKNSLYYGTNKVKGSILVSERIKSLPHSLCNSILPLRSTNTLFFFLLYRLSLSDNTYKATKTPVFVKENENIHTSVEAYLGKSEKGIYYVTLHKHQILVWSLNESSQLMEWVPQHHSNLLCFARHSCLATYHTSMHCGS